MLFEYRYHHISVLVYTWVNYIDYDPPLRYFMTINLFVHGLMYSYYALKVRIVFRLVLVSLHKTGKAYFEPFN
jgi:hypothetical protein